MTRNEIQALYQKEDADYDRLMEICDRQFYGFLDGEDGESRFSSENLGGVTTFHRRNSRTNLAAAYFLFKGHTMEDLFSDDPAMIEEKMQAGAELRELLENKGHYTRQERDDQLAELFAQLYRSVPELFPIQGNLENDQVLAANVLHLRLNQAKMDIMQSIKGNLKQKMIRAIGGQEEYNKHFSLQIHYSAMKEAADRRREFIMGEMPEAVPDETIFDQAAVRATLAYYNRRSGDAPLFPIDRAIKEERETKKQIIKQAIQQMEGVPEGKMDVLRDYALNPEVDFMIRLDSAADWQNPGTQRLVPTFTPEFLQKAKEKEEARHRFYTPIQGMEGVGAPSVASASASFAQGQPAQAGGGTYSGIEVNETVMEAIKRGNGGSHFYFEPCQDKPGFYSMHPTYPEYGADEPGGEPYKLRENVNRLYKGIASHLVNEQGEVDYREGARFMREFEERFTQSKSLENPWLSPREVAQENIRWLCSELRIPEDAREDFSRFAKSCVYDQADISDHYVFGQRNFFDVINNWISSGLEGEKYLRSGEMGDADIREYISPGMETSKQEILELAGMDPVSERRMIIPTECNGSAFVNEALFRRGFYASQDGHALGRFMVCIKEEQTALVKRRDDLRQALRKMIDQPEQEGQALLNERIQQLSKEWAEAEEETKKSELFASLQTLVQDPVASGRQLLNERIALISPELADLQREIDAKSLDDPQTTSKWNIHEATVAASFELEQPDGTKKPYFIALEGFAPKYNVLMDHAGITSAVSLGIYESEKEFQQYYLQDNEMVREDDPINVRVIAMKEDRFVTREAVNGELFAFPSELAAGEFAQQAGTVRRELQDGFARSYWGAESNWAKGVDDPNRKNRQMGIQIEGAADELAVESRRAQRSARQFSSRVPENHQVTYQALVGAFGDLNYQINSMSIQERCFRDVGEKQETSLHDPSLSPEERQQIQGTVAILQREEEAMAQRSVPFRQARFGARTMLAAMMYGETYQLEGDEREAFDRLMKPYGLTADKVEAMAEAIKGSQLPVSQIAMDVQEAVPGLAGALMEAENLQQLSVMAADFAVDNFDAALRGTFLPEEQKSIQALGMELYDQILVNGKPVSQMLKESEMEMTEDLAKCAVMAAACCGEQVEFALGFSGEKQDGRIPLRVTSEIPEVRKALKEKEAEKAERQAAKMREEMKKEDTPEVEAEAEAEAEVKEEAETGTEPEVETELEAGTEPEVETELEAGTEPEVETELEAGTEPEAETELEAGTEPEAEAELEVETEMEAGAEPEPEEKKEAPNTRRRANSVSVQAISLAELLNEPDRDPVRQRQQSAYAVNTAVVPEKRYIEMPLTYGLFERNASLRDYDFDMDSGERTVQKGKKIGNPIKKGESIRIIYPLVESEDRQWVQAMGNDGTCGYIRRSRIDETVLRSKADEAKVLPSYRLILSEGRMKDDSEMDSVEALYQEISEIDPSFRIDGNIIGTSISHDKAKNLGSKGTYLYNLLINPEEKPSSGNPFGKEFHEKEALLTSSLREEFHQMEALLASSLGEGFDKMEVCYGTRFYAEERCRARKEFQKRAMEEMTISVHDINSDATRNEDMKLVADINHSSPDSKVWMAERIRNGDEGFENVDTIYIEQLMEGPDQKLLDEYLNASNPHVPMPMPLDQFCKAHLGFREILTAVREHNLNSGEDERIRVVGIGSELAQTDTNDASMGETREFQQKIERAAKFNLRAKEIIAANPHKPGKKGVIFAGTAHMAVHPCEETGKVIPGFCQIYNQDAVGVDVGQMKKYSKDSVVNKAAVMREEINQERVMTLEQFKESEGIRPERTRERAKSVKVGRSIFEEEKGQAADRRKPAERKPKTPEQKMEKSSGNMSRK